MKEKEIWKDILRWEGYYQASTCGRIKSLRRKVKCGNKFIIIKERILKEKFNKQNGYLSVIFSKDNKQKTCYIHKLILLTFKGQCPPGKECCHNDGNKLNNYVNNLRYDTKKGNQADRKKHGTMLYNGDNPCNRKLTTLQVYQIRKLLKFGKYYQWEIAQKFNVIKQTISDIKTGKRWRWLK